MYGVQAMATWWCTAPQRTSRSGGPQRPPCGAAGRTVSPTTPPSPSTSRCWASHYHAYVQHVLGTLLQPQGCSGHGSSNGLCCSTPAILHLCRMSCPCKGVWQARREAQVQRSDNLVACAGLRRVHHGQHGRRHPALGGAAGTAPCGLQVRNDGSLALVDAHNLAVLVNGAPPACSQATCSLSLDRSWGRLA